MPPDSLPRHRTARERAAAESAALAVERARAHTAPSFDPDGDQPGPTGYVTPAVARLIREQIERRRNHA